jgi:Arc/MetJ-type ribon-helix-helix transcriptional regulator
MDNMKTIAVTIDEATLRLLDDLTAGESRRRTRSALVRAALREFAERERRRQIEEREREIFRKSRRQLAREARLLVGAQARP